MRLHQGALVALRELYSNPAFKDVKLAAASSSLVVEYSQACMRGLEIVPGVPVEEVFSFQQIGRQGKLSPDKTTHFRELIQESGIPYEEMLFFDDCSWDAEKQNEKTNNYSNNGIISSSTAPRRQSPPLPQGTVRKVSEGFQRYDWPVRKVS